MTSAATLEVEGGVGRCLSVYSTAALMSAWVRVRGRSSAWTSTIPARTTATAPIDVDQRCRATQVSDAVTAAFRRAVRPEDFAGAGVGTPGSASGDGAPRAAPVCRGGLDQAEPL